MCGKIIYLFLTGEGLLAYGGDNPDVRRQDFEDDVEADLIVPGSGAAVRYAACSCPAYMPVYLEGLEYSLGADGEGVGGVFEDVAENKILKPFFVVGVRGVYSYVGCGS